MDSMVFWLTAAGRRQFHSLFTQSNINLRIQFFALIWMNVKHLFLFLALSATAFGLAAAYTGRNPGPACAASSQNQPLIQDTSMNVIEAFYTAFAQKDAAAMTALYHDDVEFEDPAFGKLKGDRAKAMWQMLVGRGGDLRVEFRDVVQNGDKGSAHWDAYYTFGATGRKVVNKIDATFELKDGKIYRHTDVFNLHRWARQALGFKGLLFGGAKFFKAKLQAQTNGLLDKFMEKR